MDVIVFLPMEIMPAEVASDQEYGSWPGLDLTEHGFVRRRETALLIP
ncbi:hypothetical protein [Aestuariivita sp.]|jgi:hypothetical protein|nr:hypothetical protein [Aestuariivita sp.]MCE8006227.1 hypothetical protein [Aestuariivita sp.]